jgi:hypothetical protein
LFFSQFNTQAGKFYRVGVLTCIGKCLFYLQKMLIAKMKVFIRLIGIKIPIENEVGSLSLTGLLPPERIESCRVIEPSLPGATI